MSGRTEAMQMPQNDRPLRNAFFFHDPHESKTSMEFGLFRPEHDGLRARAPFCAAPA